MSQMKPTKHLLSLGILVLLCTVALAATAWIYPRWTDAVARASASDYRDQVRRAQDAGDLAGAREIAQYAVRMRSFDPEAHTTLAQVLRAAGDREGARKRYEAALAIDSTPGPDYRPTRQPWYFATARLDLGQMAIEDGDVWEAVRNFELARGYAHLEQPEFAAYHDILYKTYGALGQWSRALTYGAPTDEELALFDRRNLENLVAACEARQEWELGLRAATALINRAPLSPQGHKMAFRALLLQRQLDQAETHLRVLLEGNAVDARYWEARLEEARGHLPETALAFLATDSRSIYRPFALALAHKILTALPAELVPANAPAPATILADLDNLAERAGTVFVQPTTPYTDALLTPVGFDPPDADGLRAGAFPVVTRWEYHNVTPDQPPVAQVSVGERDAMTLYHGKNILQLQWTENALPFTGFDRLEEGMTAIPGWVEPRLSFSGEVAVSSATVAFEGQNAALKVTSPDDKHIAQIWSVPLPALRDGNYLAAGRMRSDGAKGHLAWDSKDPLEVHTINHYLADSAQNSRWTWSAAYQRRLFEDQSLRMLLGIYQNAGTVWFDDLLLIPLVEPFVAVPDTQQG